MPTSQFVRDNAFSLVREDLALFLEEHEPDLLTIFREEMEVLDEKLPEEEIYIDLDVAGIGDMLMKAVLHTLVRFLRQPVSATPPPKPRRYRRDLRRITPTHNLLNKLKRPKRQK